MRPVNAEIRGMPYKGHVENGTIVLEDEIRLPEGAKVSVRVEREKKLSSRGVPLSERLASVIGKAEGLPEDWSENHDDYLRDAHRR